MRRAEDEHGRDDARRGSGPAAIAAGPAADRAAPAGSASTPLFGIGLKIASALVFTLMSSGIKWIGSDYPTGQIVFFRSAFALLPLAIWLGWQGDLLTSVRTSDLRGHVLRGLISSFGMFSGFLALSYLPLADSVAIGYASPLITVMFAALFLRERVRAYRWSAVGIGFVGVIVMLAPHLRAGGDEPATMGALFGLLAAFCSAGATIQVRRLTATESTGAIVLYFTLLTTTLGASTVLFGWTMPPPGHAALLVVIGILGGIGQILLTASYRHADASLVAPFDYTTMIWAFLFSWLAFGQFPDNTVLFGAAIVALAGLFVIWREQRLGLRRVKQAETGVQRAT